MLSTRQHQRHDIPDDPHLGQLVTQAACRSPSLPTAPATLLTRAQAIVRLDAIAKQLVRCLQREQSVGLHLVAQKGWFVWCMRPAHFLAAKNGMLVICKALLAACDMHHTVQAIPAQSFSRYALTELVHSSGKVSQTLWAESYSHHLTWFCCAGAVAYNVNQGTAQNIKFSYSSTQVLIGGSYNDQFLAVSPCRQFKSQGYGLLSCATSKITLLQMHDE